MPTESLYPDGEYGTKTNFTGDYTSVDDPQATPGADWMDPTDDGSDTETSFSFPTPSGNLNTGAGLQTLKVHVRKQLAGGNDPAMSIYIQDGGVDKLLVADSVTVTSDTGQDFTYTWDASVLDDVSGVSAGVRVYGTRAGGNPSSRRSLSIGAVEWVADYSVAAPNVDGAASVSSTNSTTGSGDKGAVAGASTSATCSTSETGVKATSGAPTSGVVVVSSATLLKAVSGTGSFSPVDSLAAFGSKNMGHPASSTLETDAQMAGNKVGVLVVNEALTMDGSSTGAKATQQSASSSVAAVTSVSARKGVLSVVATSLASAVVTLSQQVAESSRRRYGSVIRTIFG